MGNKEVLQSVSNDELDLINNTYCSIEGLGDEFIGNVTELHNLYRHETSLDFCFYGWHCGDYSEEKNLLHCLNKRDKIQIKALFYNGMLNENIEGKEPEALHNFKSYNENMEYRRQMTKEEKMVFLRYMNSIYGSEGRTRAIMIMFREKHTEEERNTLLEEILRSNQTKVESAQKEGLARAKVD